MANTAVGNLAAALSGALLSTEAVKFATLTLTDANIKAVGFFEIVAAVGGKVLTPIWALIITDTTAGAYTNVDAASTIRISTKSNTGFGLNLIDNVSISTPTLAKTIDYMLKGTRKTIVKCTDDLFNSKSSYTQNYEVGPQVQLYSDYVGNIGININNGGSGSITGGNAANTMKVILAYSIVTP